MWASVFLGPDVVWFGMGGQSGCGWVRFGAAWRGATSKANRLGSGFDKRNVCVSMLGVVSDTTTNDSLPTRDATVATSSSVAAVFYLVRQCLLLLRFFCLEYA